MEKYPIDCYSMGAVRLKYPNSNTLLDFFSWVPEPVISADPIHFHLVNIIALCSEHDFRMKLSTKYRIQNLLFLLVLIPCHV